MNMRIIKPESTILKSQKSDDIEIDWDELDKFWADRYEADYGNYILHKLKEKS
jgi:hypothetical protein